MLEYTYVSSEEICLVAWSTTSFCAGGMVSILQWLELWCSVLDV